MKEVLFCLPSKLTVAFAILGNYPIIVPTCCSNAIFKVTPKRTHGRTAKLLRDDTLLPHPQPAEVQKSCCGNHAGTRIFLTWFYILTLKGCSNFALPYTPGAASLSPFPLSLSPLPFSQMPSTAGIILHQAWFCGSLQQVCCLTGPHWEQKAEEIKDKYENNQVKVIGRESTPRAKPAWHTYRSPQSLGTWPVLVAKSSCTYR